MPAFIDLSGKRFGRLVVRGPVRDRHPRKVYWACVCDCGAEKVIYGRQLRTGDCRSCGCLQRETVTKMNLTHGLSKTRIFKIWAGMLARCTNPNEPGYRHYGAKGVTVCFRWWKFENFYADMGPSYRDGLTIDRQDNAQGYSLDNCRWISSADQQRNRRSGKEWNLSEAPTAKNTTGLRGVHFNKATLKWRASISVNRKQKNLGEFRTKEEAHAAYLEARRTMR